MNLYNWKTQVKQTNPVACFGSPGCWRGLSLAYYLNNIKGRRVALSHNTVAVSITILATFLYLSLSSPVSDICCFSSFYHKGPKLQCLFHKFCRWDHTFIWHFAKKLRNTHTHQTLATTSNCHSSGIIFLKKHHHMKAPLKCEFIFCAWFSSICEGAKKIAVCSTINMPIDSHPCFHWCEFIHNTHPMLMFLFPGHFSRLLHATFFLLTSLQFRFQMSHIIFERAKKFTFFSFFLSLWV